MATRAVYPTPTLRAMVEYRDVCDVRHQLRTQTLQAAHKKAASIKYKTEVFRAYGKGWIPVEPEPVKYRLYMKERGDRAFKAVNWRTGEWAGNLALATVFTEAEKIEACKSLGLEENSELVFEWRVAGV